MPGNAHRPLTALVLLLTVPLIIGSLAAPWVFSFVRTIPAFADDGFTRVATRCVQVAALLLLWPAIRLSGMSAEIGAALRPDARRWRDLRVSILVGCLTMFALYVAGFHLGAYVPGDEAEGVAHLLAKGLLFLPGAALVGLLEEAFFRGFFFGALRRRMPFVAAAVLASLFFSAIHFARPRAPVRITDPGWLDGFQLIPHLFARFRPEYDWPFAVTLFLMGLALCLYYRSSGDLFVCIGLHGGWVWAMRLGELLVERDRSVLPLLFGRGDYAARAAVAIPLIAAFALYALLASRRKGSPSL